MRLSCVESDAGDFRFKVPGKRNAAVRQVVLEEVVADAVRAHLADLGEVPRGPNIVAGARALPQRLFFTREGNPFRRSHLRTLFDRATAEVPGWPEGATWHYLRHYAATRWIRRQVDVATVSKMLGHRQVSTTLVCGRRRGLTRPCRGHPRMRTRRCLSRCAPAAPGPGRS